MKSFMIALMFFVMTACSTQVVRTVEVKPNDSLFIRTTQVEFPSEKEHPAIIAMPAIAEVALPTPLNPADIHCLALALYHESRGEGRVGMAAVGYVILNRVESKHFPNDVCSVVKQGPKLANGQLVRNRCQFNFTCDGRSDEMKDLKSAAFARDLAKLILLGMEPNPIAGSTFFHESKYRPSWSKVFRLEQKIGNHLFYYNPKDAVAFNRN